MEPLDRWSRGILGLVGLAAILASGCGGPPRELRVALAETAGAVAEADRIHAEQVRARSEALVAELRTMAREGRVASVEAGLAWYDERMGPHETGVRVLEGAASALRAVELALDGWAAGESGAELRVGQTISCSVAAIGEAVTVLRAVGLDVPEAITTWAGIAAHWASAGCPEGG